jgi:predicted Zn-dependent peptidase
MMFKGTTLFDTLNPHRELTLLDQIDALYRTLHGENGMVRLAGGEADAATVAMLKKENAALEAEARRFILPNELWETYRRNGGVRLNAFTSSDGTQSFASLPRNRLELWALFESDRMRNPEFLEFYTEREVVQEGRRQRVDTNPGGQLFEAVLATAFVAFPYSHPVTGWPNELENLTRPQPRDFFGTCDAPNNSLAVLVGDLDPAEVIRIVDQYFASIPAPPIPPSPALVEPPQLGERRSASSSRQSRNCSCATRAPNRPPGHFALSVLGPLLGDGRSSRLYKRLVGERRLTTSVAAGPWFYRHGGLFLIQATPRVPHTLKEIEAAVDEEIQRAKSERPRDREMTKVRN